MMQKVFDETGTLDKRCYEQFGLSEDILMEHAAISMLNFIEAKLEGNSNILIVSGAGNNGADGIALARLLQGRYNITLFLPFGAKSPMAKLQLERAGHTGIEPLISYECLLQEYDLVVDCLFGSGLNRELDANSQKIIEKLNQSGVYKLSCDIPSGIDNKGQINSVAFKADTTITMGALKTSLFNDEVKDFTGEIMVADLGLQRKLYESDTNHYLLDMEDIKLPYRQSQNTNKGSFGHFAVIVGQKTGAGMLCAEAGYTLGAGLVSVIDHHHLNPPYHIMENHKLPENTTAIAIGMGLGNYEKSEILNLLNNDIPKVIDADLFYEEDILGVLDKENIILTPHPKEFCSLLKISNIANIDVKTLQKNRFLYVKKFCEAYSNVVLLLKGANTLIAKEDEVYINPHGSSKLSFGGSGDVLAGFIGSLVAQGYEPLDAAINGSLIHAKTAKDYQGNDFSMTPFDLINGVKMI